MFRNSFFSITCASCLIAPGLGFAQQAKSQTSEEAEETSAGVVSLKAVEAEYRELVCSRAADADNASQDQAIELALAQNYMDERFNGLVRQILEQDSRPGRLNRENLLRAYKMLPLCTFDAEERCELVFGCYLRCCKAKADYEVVKRLKAVLSDHPDQTSRLVNESMKAGKDAEPLLALVTIVGASSKEILPQVLGLAKSEDSEIASFALQLIPTLIEALRERERVAAAIAERRKGGSEGMDPQNIDPKMVRYAERIIVRYDKNRDGELTLPEYSQMLLSPASADIDGNGRITAIEYAAWLQSRQQR